MNVQEGISLAKMAVAVLLLCLVIGSAMTIWYLMVDTSSVQEDKWERAAVSAASDRLNDLVQQSQNANRLEEYPLVTNACNALQEFTEDGLIFVSIYVNNGATKKTDVFTYNGVTETELQAPHDGSTYVHHTSSTPVTEACSVLLREYNMYRCNVTKIDVAVDNTGKYIESSKPDVFIAYDIQVFVH